MKKKVVLLLLISLVFGFGSAAAQQDKPPHLNLASWNIRMLTDGSRDDLEISKIAKIMSFFDLVAVQEARDIRVLERLKAKLPGWTFIASLPVGRGQKEIYAFFWKKEKVSRIGKGVIFKDPQDVFIREPYVASFKSGEFDFTLCTIHLLYGSSKSERRRELVLMDEVVSAVQKANGPEQDIILLGDFNFSPRDRGWQLKNWTPLFLPPLKTTIGDKSLYDNIWIKPDWTSEYINRRGMIKFDQEWYKGNLKKASLEVSDHRPVWAMFRTDKDDDPDYYGNLAAVGISGAVRVVTPLPSRTQGKMTVYITKTGKKYHQDGCSSLRRSKIPISLKQAKKRVYEPCSRCNPPR